MIASQASAAAAVRAGEGEIAGRRIAGRLLIFAGETRSLRFDIVERRFVLRRRDGGVPSGSADSDAWREAVARLPAGPVLVGPGAYAEAAPGGFRAAARGALDAGRPVYLLDPGVSDLPEGVKSAVVLCSWRPGPVAAFPALPAAAAAGLPCGVLFPLIPGWTAEPTLVEALLSEAKAGGAVSATPLRPDSGGEARRAIVEARAAVEPDAADRFFDLIHHSDWSSSLPEQLKEAQAACARRELAALPPRPTGWREPAGNSAAAARLEELAELSEADEHRAALLRGAVRWIDECGRDLAAVTREGNFRKVFPFEEEIAKAAEAAFAAAR
jgi:hypothetical protein